MDPIIVPRAKGKYDPNRPAGSLLLAQVHHLHEAEKNLPSRYHSGIFHKAIQTEADAAEYIKAVTEAIHAAHDQAPAERLKRARARKPKGVIEIAAVADEAAERKPRTRSNKSSKGEGKS